MNTIDKIEKKQIEKLLESKQIPDFAAGDTIRVNVKVQEGNRTRTQAYEGVCIARKNAGVNSSFTVRKISHGEGVERVFPLYSPLITIEVVRKGKVRRAKLYYLRGLTGKKARITEKKDFVTKTEGKEAKKPAAKKAEAAPKVAPKAEAKKEEAPKAEAPKVETKETPEKE